MLYVCLSGKSGQQLHSSSKMLSDLDECDTPLLHRLGPHVAFASHSGDITARHCHVNLSGPYHLLSRLDFTIAHFRPIHEMVFQIAVVLCKCVAKEVRAPQHTVFVQSKPHASSVHLSASAVKTSQTIGDDEVDKTRQPETHEAVRLRVASCKCVTNALGPTQSSALPGRQLDVPQVVRQVLHRMVEDQS